MDPHLLDAILNKGTIPEVAKRRIPQALGNTGLASRIGKIAQPLVETF
jgi:hypothetical protein